LFGWSDKKSEDKSRTLIPFLSIYPPKISSQDILPRDDDEKWRRMKVTGMIVIGT